MLFEAMHPIWQIWLDHLEPMVKATEKRVLNDTRVTPEIHLVMRAFEQNPTGIKVVVLGQDPYPTKGYAVGLAFAISSGSKVPRSLVNIINELKVDLPEVVVNPQHPDLSKWSKQGVLLLNTALTTVSGKAGAHSKIGWEEFTFEAIVELAARNKIVLICWGARAISLGRKISKLHSDGQIHLIESAHPSPLSARKGFFGSRPFSRTNSALESLGLEPIDWSC